MDADRLDLTALDPTADGARFDGMVARIMERAAPEPRDVLVYRVPCERVAERGLGSVRLDEHATREELVEPAVRTDRGEQLGVEPRACDRRRLGRGARPI